MTKQALRTLAHNVGTVSKAPHTTALDTVRAQHNYESSVEVRRSEEAQALAGDCGIVGEQDEHTDILLLDERYKVGRKLNEGSFGAVYTAVDLQKNIVYAAKFVTAPSPLPEIVTHARLGAPPRLGGRFAARLRKSILHEAAVLRRLGPHAHIVQLICEHDQGLVLELAASDLSNLLDRGKLESETAHGIFKQVVTAVAHCHHAGIYHLDIKPSNILVVEDSSTGAQLPTVKLCDFGGSVQTSNPQQALTGTVGSMSYMAPEVLAAQSSWTPGPVDCWAVGVLLYALLTSDLPFERATTGCKRFCQLSTDQFDFGTVSDRIDIEVLSMLWKLQPLARMTSDALLEHALLNSESFNEKDQPVET